MLASHAKITGCADFVPVWPDLCSCHDQQPRPSQHPVWLPVRGPLMQGYLLMHLMSHDESFLEVDRIRKALGDYRVVLMGHEHRRGVA